MEALSGDTAWLMLPENPFSTEELHAMRARNDYECLLVSAEGRNYCYWQGCTHYSEVVWETHLLEFADLAVEPEALPTA